jgi:hypothetical protein
MKRKYEKNSHNFSIINCCLEGFEPYGIFVGAMMSLKWNGHLHGNMTKMRSLVRKGNQACRQFHNEVSEELEKFLTSHNYDYTIEGKINFS